MCLLAAVLFFFFMQACTKQIGKVGDVAGAAATATPVSKSSGQGAGPSASGKSLASPAFEFAPVGADFGSVKIGESAQLTIQVKSIVDVPVFIRGVSELESPFSFEKMTCPTQGAALGMAQSCAVTLSFTPRKPDQNQDKLVFTFSDVAFGGTTFQQPLSLSGLGEIPKDTIPPKLRLASPSRPFVNNSGSVSLDVVYSGADFVTLKADDIIKTSTGNAVCEVSVAPKDPVSRKVVFQNCTGNGTIRFLVAAKSAADEAGNLAPESAQSEVFTVDNIPPDKPALSGAALTGNPRPTVHVSPAADASAIFRAQVDSSVFANSTAEVSGTDFVPESNLSEGSHTAYVQSRDAAGNWSDTESFTFAVDLTPPALVLSSPAANTSAQASLTLSGTCETGLAVIFSGSGVTADSSVSCIGGAFTKLVNFSSGDGTKSIRVSQVDLAGNIAVVTRSFLRDTTAPALSLLLPAVDTTGQTGVTISGTCEAGLVVTLSGAGISSPAFTTCLAGTFSQALVFTAGEGSKAVTLSQADAVGNMTSVSRNFVRDNTAPGLAFGAPTGTSLNVASNASLPIVYSGADSVSLQSSDLSTTVVSGTPSCTLTANATGLTNRSLGITNCSGNGTFTVSVASGTAADLAGNNSAAIGPSVLFTVDNVAPTAPVVAGVANTTNAQPTWSWTSGGGGNGTFRFKLENSTLSTGAATTTSLNYTPATGVSDGPHILYVQERDDAGNWSPSGSFSTTVDNTPPNLTLTSPTSNTAAPSGVTLAGTCENGVPIVLGGAGLSSPLSATCTAGAFSQAILFTATDGTKTVTLSQTDGAGNSTLVTRDFLRDNVAPPLTLTSHSDGSWITSSNVTLTGTCEDGLPISVTGSGLAAVTSNAACSSGTFSKAVVVTSIDGNKALSLNQTDSAGNATTVSFTLQKDAAGPALTITTPVNNAATQSGFTATGACETGLAVTLTGDITGAPVTATCSAAAYSQAFVLTAAQGAKTLLVSQTDAAGNTTTLSRTLYKDSVAPTLTVTTTDGTKGQGALLTTGTCETGLLVGLSGSGLSSPNFTTCSAGGFSQIISFTGTDGSKAIVFTQIDDAGNTTTVSRTFASDTTAPTLNLGAPSALLANGSSTVTVDANYTGANSVTLSTSDVVLTATGSATCDKALSGAGTSARTVTLSNCTGNGTISVSLSAGTAADDVGNLAPAAGPSTAITIDNLAPTSPTVTGISTTTSQTPTWSWTSSGGGNGTFRYKLDSSDLTSGATTTTSLSFTPGMSLTDAAHTLYVQERDAVGNWSSSGSFVTTVDTTPPSSPLISASTPTQNLRPTWTWLSGGGGNGTYRYKLDDSNLTAGATSDTSTSFTPNADLAEGNHTVYVQERDAAGNWSNSASKLVAIYSVGFPAPTITSLSPAFGISAGGTSVTLTGTGFRSGVVASLDGVDCTSTTLASATSIVCVTPANAKIDSVTAAVRNADSQTGSMPEAFVYLGSPKVWLRADAGITTDGSGNVSAWADQSGNGYDVSQGTANARPAFGATALNGKPAIQCDGSNDALSRSTGPNIVSNGNLDFFGVITPVNLVNSGRIFSFKSTGYGDWNSHNGLEMEQQTSSLMVFQGQASLGSNPGATPFLPTSPTLSANSTVLFELQRSTTAGLIKINGSAGASAGFSLNSGTHDAGFALCSETGIENDSSASAAQSVGVPGHYGRNNISEFLVYDVILTTAQRTVVENLLRTRYALPTGSTLGAPLVAGTSPTNSLRPTWTWTSAGGGVKTGTYRYKLDSTDLASGTTNTVVASYTPAFDLSNGLHTLYVQEKDTNGAWGATGSFAITTDNTNPAPTFSSPASLASVPATTTVSGTCETGINVTISGSGTTGSQTFSCPAGTYSRSVTFTSGEDNKTITVSQTDAAGNTGTVSRVFVRDSIAPSLVLSLPTTGTTGQTGVILSGTCEDGILIALSGSGLSSPTSAACSSGSFLQGITFTAGEGTKTISVSQTDPAGNATTISRDFARDNTAPGISISSPNPTALSSTGSLEFIVSFSGATNVTLQSIDITKTATGSASCSGTDQWIACAAENGTCSFTGTKTVRYGASGSYNSAPKTNGTACTNAVFGDPISGIPKTCAYLQPGGVSVSGSGVLTRTLTVGGCTGDGTIALGLASGTAADGAGNLSASLTSATASVDNTAPTITSFTLNSGATTVFSNFVTANVTASDSRISTDVSVRFAEKSGGTCPYADNSWQTHGGGAKNFAATFSSGVGTKVLCVWAKDTTGNISAPAEASVDYQLNAPPFAANSSTTTAEDIPVSVTLDAIDQNSDPLTYTIANNPAHGSLSGTAPNLTYTPDANWSGSDFFTFKANDGIVDSNTGVVTITVSAVNDPPAISTSATNHVFPLNQSNVPLIQGTNYTFPFTATDVDSPAPTLSCTYYTAGVSTSDVNYAPAGTACTSLPSLVTTNSISVLGNATFTAGTLSWTPTYGQFGTYVVTVKATDSSSAESTSSLTLSVRANTSTTNLFGNYDASFSLSASGNPYGPRLTATSTNNVSSNWPDLMGGTSLGVSQFVTTAPWVGNGTASSPYALSFAATGDKADVSGAAATSFTAQRVSAWLAPTSPTTPRKVIFSNSDTNGKGFILRQSADGRGAVELVQKGSPTYLDEVLTDSPIHLYAMNEQSGTTLYDAGSNPANGAYASSGVTLGASGPNTSSSSNDTAVTFSSSSASLAQPSDIQFTPTSQFTIESWIKGSSNGDFIGTSDPGNNYQGYILYACGTDTNQCTTGGVKLYLISNWPTNGLAVYSTTGTNFTSVNDNAWHHVVLTYNGTYVPTGVQIFVDGLLQPTAVESNSLPSNGNTVSSQNLRIGQRNGAGNSFNGSIDNLAFYSNVLSQSRVTAHYNARTRPACLSSTSLAANSWKKISAMMDGTAQSLFVNGLRECNTTSSTALSNNSANFTFGQTLDNLFSWAGKIADIKIFGGSASGSAGTSSDEFTDFNSTANRFRAVPVENIVASNLLLHLDPANANGGISPFSSGCPSTVNGWRDISTSGASISTASYTSCGANLGWNGSGSVADPYRLSNTSGARFSTPVVTTSTTAVTLMGWYRARTLPQIGLLFYHGNSQSTGFGPAINNASGTPGSTLSILCGGVTWNCGPTFNLSANTWYHIAVTRSGTTMSLYVNGALIGQNSSSPNNVSGSQTDGNDYGTDAGNGTLAGDYGPQMVYGRALTLAEIKQNCLAQQARFTASANICAAP